MNTSEPGNSIKVFNIKNFISLAYLHSFLDYTKMENVFPFTENLLNNDTKNLLLGFYQQLSIIKNLKECLLCGASKGRFEYEQIIV